VRYAQKTPDHPKAHVAHSREQNAQGLHRRMLAAWFRVGEIAAAILAKILLPIMYHPVFHMVFRTATLADDPLHGIRHPVYRPRIAPHLSLNVYYLALSKFSGICEFEFSCA
jgi:hypothetical protein